MVTKSEIIFYLLVLFGFSLSISQKCESYSDYCANPIVETENKIDIQWIHEHYKDGWNIQFGNAVVRRRLAKLILGKDLEKDMDFSNMCLRVSLDFIDPIHIIGNFSGFGGQAATFKCTDEDHIYSCEFENTKTGYKDSAIIYLVYFDGKEDHNVLGTALCYPDGDIGWYLNTISKNITVEETQTFADRLKSIGLNPELRVPMQSPSCT